MEGRGTENVMLGRPSDGSDGRSGKESEIDPREGSKLNAGSGTENVIAGSPSEGSEGRSGNERDIDPSDGSKLSAGSGTLKVRLADGSAGRLGKSGRLKSAKLHIQSDDVRSDCISGTWVAKMPAATPTAVVADAAVVP